MRVIRSASVATALALLSGFAMAGQPGAVQLPIQSEAGLQEYLAVTPIEESPLSRLSPMGRRRFLEDIHFTSRGISGYGTADLMAELTAEEIQAVLALFDLPVSESLLRDARDVNRNELVSDRPLPKVPTAIGHRFDQLRAMKDVQASSDLGVTALGRSRAIRDGYDRLFGSASVSPNSVSDSDLHLLFRAASIAMFGTTDPKYFDAMDLPLAELRARGLASKDDYRMMHAALVLARDFERADALALDHPALELSATPPIVERVPAGHSGPTEWAVSPDNYELIHQKVALDLPAKVIVVAHPDCGFSRAAMQAIESDPVLGPLFAEHAHWLAPQAQRLGVERLQQWNRKHPSVEMTLAVDTREWPMMDDWATPNFYFFKDGELKARVSGWPLDGAGHRDKVVAALGEIGLLDPQYSRSYCDAVDSYPPKLPAAPGNTTGLCAPLSPTAETPKK